MESDTPSEASVMIFRKSLLAWFRTNGRRFPWRETDEPFKVLMAELMLRRTRADQVKSVYCSLLNEYPNAFTLARANPGKVQSIVASLGLNWRLGDFQEVSRVLVARYEGIVPSEKGKLLELPGVGEYVASAVLSLAFNKCEPIIDSNVVRVFKRYFGLHTSKEGRRDKNIITLAEIYVSNRNPRKANLALLDFAALVCSPHKPRHEKCKARLSCKLFNAT
jgi:A/G-specific adenine glycosylase